MTTQLVTTTTRSQVPVTQQQGLKSSPIHTTTNKGLRPSHITIIRLQVSVTQKQ